MNRFIIPAIIFGILVVLLFVGLQHDNQKFTSAFMGKQAPDFKSPNLLLTSASSDPATITKKLFKGKVVVLNFWASWCGGCIVEHPVLMQLSKDKRLSMFGIAYKDGQVAALKFLKNRGNPFKFVGHDQPGDAGLEYGVSKVPETFIIDKAGVVRYKQLGAISQKKLHNVILPLIEKLSKEPYNK